MRLHNLLFLTILLALTNGVAAENRIVGGTPAAAGEFPFIVSLQRGSSHFCGGSLIKKNWVLTAAHCVRSGTSSLRVKIGLLNLKDNTGVETFTAKQVIVHPQNNSSTNENDLALINLDGESKFAPVILNNTTIDIPDEESKAPIATTMGWGTTSEGGKISQKLLKVDVPLVNSKNCANAYPGKTDKTMICAGYQKGGKDSCQGDSGGPLIVKLATGETVLAGAVSWGMGCARPKKYGVYADVNFGLSWIESQIEKN